MVKECTSILIKSEPHPIHGKKMDFEAYSLCLCSFVVCLHIIYQMHRWHIANWLHTQFTWLDFTNGEDPMIRIHMLSKTF